MKKYQVMLLAAGMFFACAAAVYAQDAAEVAQDAVEAVQEPVEFGGVAAEASSDSATVEAVNAEGRTVTLKNSAGDVQEIHCGPEVRNFDQIKVGDIVRRSVMQYAEVTVMPDANAPLARKQELEISGAPLGAKPEGTITATLKVMAVVEDIDVASRQVLIQGPERKVTVNVGPEAKNFEKVKKGDNVYLELMEITQISVASE